MKSTNALHANKCSLQPKSYRFGSCRQFWYPFFNPTFQSTLFENALLFYFQIVHLKRFQHLNGRWIKSHKVKVIPGSLIPTRSLNSILVFFQNVNFPFRNFDPTTYLASVPKKTLERFLELKLASKAPGVRQSCSSADMNNGDASELIDIITPEDSGKSHPTF